ncbi:nucleolar complex protein 3 homolog [Sinocyclocheilus rhinocerous]|uniref:nucleolar complex protein 3 homolog n=1 Tax=Sinocyclocheilus rhinocerous TaxID=307959 RepID=UPI0007B9C79F|nr:PREDICTED: nucleolar complex protein 3 homolog [Sinocyclocheilus rhinocerous]
MVRKFAAQQKVQTQQPLLLAHFDFLRYCNISLYFCRTPVQLFEDYSVKDMTFSPPVAGPPSKKKEHFTIGDAFADSELKTQIDAALQNASEQTSLDFTSQHTQQDT